jgi:hypothetical protein
MTRALLLGILLGMSGPALAQTSDTKLETYKFLLGEANDRVVQANGQIAALQAEIARLKADLEKATAAKKD